MHCARCTVHCALCTVQCALCMESSAGLLRPAEAPLVARVLPALEYVKYLLICYVIYDIYGVIYDNIYLYFFFFT